MTLQQPAPRPVQPVAKKAGWRFGLRYAIWFVVVIWVVFILEVLTGGYLAEFGIHPLDVASLPFIFASPLLHADAGHIMSNTLPGALFALLVAMSGRRVFWEVTVLCVIIGGLGTWFFGGIGTNHIGASGLIYGWLGYLLIRGFFNKSIVQIAVGVVLFFLYGGLIWGVLPQGVGISWQGHLFGFLAGAGCGIWLKSDDPVKQLPSPTPGSVRAIYPSGRS